MEDLKHCSCGATFTERESSGRHCFRCKVRSVGFTWRGATGQTKKAFHDTTIRDAVEESNRNIVAAGGNPKDYEPIGTRWV